MSDVLDRIRDWCDAEPSMEFAGGDPATVTVTGDDPVVIALTVGDDRIHLSHERRFPGGSAMADTARELLGTRGSLLTGSVVAAGDGCDVAIAHRVYLDGLNRQAFVAAALEVAGTVDTLRAVAAEVDVEEVPAAAAEPLAHTEPSHEARTVAPASAQSVAPAWSPTHRVPAGGMQAWTEPDPTLQPVADLAARVELSVEETRGAWARVTGSNGWTGWVDARRLQAMAASQATGGTSRGSSVAGSTAVTVVPIVAALAAAISAFVGWIQGGSNTGLDWSVGTLVSKTTLRDAIFSGGDGGFSVGIVMLAAAVAIAAAAFLPQVPAIVGRVGAIVAIVAGLAFVLQVVLVVLDLDGQVADALTDGVAAGPWVAIGAGVVGLVGSRSAQ